MKKIFYTLFIILFFTSCAPAQTTPTSEPPTSTAFVPTETPIPPSPTPVIANIEGTNYPVTGFEVRDPSGKLLYTQDIDGHWIKVTSEAAAPADTRDGFIARLAGSDVTKSPAFALSADGSSIDGVEGVKIDWNTNLATFSYDGKTQEFISTVDIRVIDKDINGNPMKPTLFIGGYSWNPETQKLEAHSPGFPMSTNPAESLGQWTHREISNGTWLRWHQRVLQGIDFNAKFAGALKPDSWSLQDIFNNRNDQNLDGKKDTIHFEALIWASGGNNYDYRFANTSEKKLEPGRSGLSFSYLDSDMVIVSHDIKNKDSTITSIPIVMDEVLWTKLTNNLNFTRTALACGVPHNTRLMATETTFNNSNDNESWDIIPVVEVAKDATLMDYGGGNEIPLLQTQEGIAGREASIKGDKIDSTASLHPWGAYVHYNYHDGPSIP